MGRCFQVFLDYHPADAALARRLRQQLDPLQRSKRINIWSADTPLPGSPLPVESRDALDAADIVIILISPDYLADDDSYERLRWAHGRRRDLQLLPVHARPSTLDEDGLPNLRLLPAGRPVSDYPDPDGPCKEIARTFQVTLDMLSSAPFGPRPTMRDVATEAFRLDRIAQWDEVKRRSARSEHSFFLLYGRRGQAVALFAERVAYLLRHNAEVPHQVIEVSVRRRVATASDIENHLRGELARLGESGADDTATMLHRLTRRYPVFLILGGVQDENWPQRERQALADFLVHILPARLPQGGRGVQALLMHEYDQPDNPLTAWIDSWAARLPGTLRYCKLPEAELPSWDEVQGILVGKGADPDTVATMQAFYKDLTRSHAPDFRRLADELDSYLR